MTPSRWPTHAVEIYALLIAETPLRERHHYGRHYE